MADSVRRVLEEMVPELEDMEQRGYFSRGEIRMIVQKRQDLEYNLQRRAALKKDFLRSIEYEKSLERLRVLRKKQRNIEGASSLSDHCIVRRTHKLYERMLRKFKGDLALWNDWIQFCASSKSARQMSKALTRAMQLHPNSAAIWTYAAAWEFEHNHNATVARSLMQTGIRMCKNDPALWMEYFRMELLYAARLGARRHVLGLSESAIDPATELLLSGGIAKVVYNNAIDAVPDDAEFRVGLLNVLCPLPIMNKVQLEDYIVNDIREQLKLVFNGVACRKLSKYIFKRGVESSSFGAALELAMQVFEDCGQQVEVYESKLLLLEEMFSDVLEDQNEEHMSLLLQECISTGEAALQSNSTSCDIVLAVSRAYRRIGQYQDGLKMLRDGPSTETIISDRLYLELYDAVASSKAETDVLMIELFASLERESRTPPVWLSALSCIVGTADRLSALADIFEKDQLAFSTCPASSERGNVASCIMMSLWLNMGIEHARRFYHKILSCPLPGVNFILEIVKMEQSLFFSGAKDAASPQAIRHVYNVGTDVYGSSSVDLWLQYYTFETRLGHDGESGMVHWKAKQVLEDADNFVSQVHLKNNDSFAEW